MVFGTDLLGWYRGESVVTDGGGTADGTAVIDLLDLSGRGNTYTQGTSTQRGTIRYPVALNGRSVVRLDGVNDNYLCGSPTTPPVNRAQPYTEYHVFSPSSVSGYRMLRSNSFNVSFTCGKNSSFTLYASTGDLDCARLTAGGAFVAKAFFNGASSTATLRGTSHYTGGSYKTLHGFQRTVTGNPGTATYGLTALRIGIGYDGVNFPFAGDIAEQVLIGRATTAGEDAAAFAHLANYYSIPGPVTGAVSVVCHGNSLTNGFGVTTPYPNRLASLLGMTVNTSTSGGVYNEGTDGITTSQMSGDFELRVNARYATAKRIAVIWEIGNDLANGTAEATALSRYTDYCTTAQAAGWLVVACTVPPRADLTGGEETARTNINASIRANFATYADALADIDAAIPVISGTYYIGDNVHLNDAGAQLVAETVWPQVDSLI